MDIPPVFLSEEAIHELHEEQIAHFGGKRGVRDAVGIGAAVASPMNIWIR